MKSKKQFLFFFISLMLAFQIPGAFSPASGQEGKDLPGLPKQEKKQLLAGYSKAVSYSGFRSGQHPDRGNGAVNPSMDQISEDLQLLLDAGFHLIRLYDCGENSEMVLQCIKKNHFDIKVMLGIWLDAEESNHEHCFWMNEAIPEQKLEANKTKNVQEIRRGIVLAERYKKIIVAVNVGNEALVDWTDHLVPLNKMISYVQLVKSAISQGVTVAENCNWWAEKGDSLAKEVDFIALHTYPIWAGKDLNESKEITLSDIARVKAKFPDKTLVISEAGWASEANEFGDRASEKKQLEYFNWIMKWAAANNYTTFFFEAFDEDWKGDPANMAGAEKHWGLFKVDRKPKLVLTAEQKK